MLTKGMQAHQGEQNKGLPQVPSFLGLPTVYLKGSGSLFCSLSAYASFQGTRAFSLLDRPTDLPIAS